MHYSLRIVLYGLLLISLGVALYAFFVLILGQAMPEGPVRSSLGAVSESVFTWYTALLISLLVFLLTILVLMQFRGKR